MEIVKEGYPDTTAFDRKHHHYDPDSDPAKPRWYMVDVRLKRRLTRVITLEELRKHAAKELQGNGAAASRQSLVGDAGGGRSLEVHSLTRVSECEFTSRVPSTLSLACFFISRAVYSDPGLTR